MQKQVLDRIIMRYRQCLKKTTCKYYIFIVENRKKNGSKRAILKTSLG
jgi:hypothetical protein